MCNPQVLYLFCSCIIEFSWFHYHPTRGEHIFKTVIAWQIVRAKVDNLKTIIVIAMTPVKERPMFQLGTS